jgi:protein gp37
VSDKTGIEWTDATWNPVTGCTKVSQGCKHCYAERGWARLQHLPAYQGREFTDVATHFSRLNQPLRWRSPRRIFVNSMSDLFHEAVHTEFIDGVFAVMAMAPQHVFQVLTKRPDRMREYLSRRLVTDGIEFEMIGMLFDKRCRGKEPESLILPLPNVWLGVSVENQTTADERIPLLLDTPAAVRWISAEPLLGDINLRSCLHRSPSAAFSSGRVTADMPAWTRFGSTAIDWVVVGGESGPKARAMHPDWARNIHNQCAAAGVPFLFKQWGEWIGDEDIDNCNLRAPEIADADQYFHTLDWPDGSQSYRVGKHAAGRLLDGVLHDGYPGVKP